MEFVISFISYIRNRFFVFCFYQDKNYYFLQFVISIQTASLALFLFFQLLNGNHYANHTIRQDN